MAIMFRPLAWPRFLILTALGTVLLTPILLVGIFALWQTALSPYWFWSLVGWLGLANAYDARIGPCPRCEKPVVMYARDQRGKCGRCGCRVYVGQDRRGRPVRVREWVI